MELQCVFVFSEKLNNDEAEHKTFFIDNALCANESVCTKD